MISQEELNSFYKEKLEAGLGELEKQRKVLRNLDLTVKVGIGILVLFYFLPNPFSLLGIEKGAVTEVLTYIIVAISVVLYGLFMYKKAPYRKQYKEKVVRSIVDLIDEKWTYSPEGMISKSQYERSKLFTKSVDAYKGDDLIKGRIGFTEFECSELQTQYKKVRGSGKNRKTSWHNIFKGLFFNADFNKYFSGETFVRTKGWDLDLLGSDSTVKLEDPNFSKIFKVKSTDQLEARYILTPNVMEAFINLYNYYRKPIDVSFVGSRVNCAVSFDEDLFAPPIYDTIYDLEVIQRVCSLFYFNQVVIDELNLNARIWMKGVGL
ncbi:DUF3137 domain-containing protein [Flammeovirga sp. SJP92]|uniref:DUF3137 domain-containing protein n=1 Tax=Flammeovirga sp. SJP92 TaxID=1775430 RepID=UPI0007876138|nr:DUF3137 domain-containing protein [Flammeovirga sp. SJP92]KXX69632.1 hypothetical protein AVL50_15335 [Flammeovirga sp. SJP92]